MKHSTSRTAALLFVLLLIATGAAYLWQHYRSEPHYLEEAVLQRGEINWLDEDGRRLSSKRHATFMVEEWEEVEGGYHVILYHTNGTRALDTYQTSLDLTVSEGFGNYRAYNEEGWLEESGAFNDEGQVHGPITGFYENGNKRIEGYTVNGERHGPFRSYYEDGNLYSEAHYQHDELQGFVQYWTEDGQLDKRKRYKGDQVIDEQLVEVRGYSSSGELSRLTILEENEHGEIWRHERYNRDSNLYARNQISVDESWQLKERFNKDGELTLRKEEVDGQSVGWYLNVSYNGSVEEGYYIDGERHGRYEHRAKDGTICSLTTYQHGQKHGPYYQCDGSGVVRERGQFRNDVQVGEWRFYSDGILSRLATYDEEGAQHGTQYVFSNNGMLQDMTEFNHGVKHGEQWDFEHGIPNERIQYRGGRAISQELAEAIPQQEWP